MKRVVTGTIKFAEFNGPATFPYMVPRETYMEFDAADGEIIATKILENCNGHLDAFQECEDLILRATMNGDKTTFNGCIEARKFMRRNGWEKLPCVYENKLEAADPKERVK